MASTEAGLTVQLVLGGESFSVAAGDDDQWTVRYGAPRGPDQALQVRPARLEDTVRRSPRF